MELNEIENKIACGEMSAAQVFTQMNQHVESSLSPPCYSSERTDTDRLDWLYSMPKDAVKSNAMTEIELGIINGEYPSHIGLREAIDKCMDE